jgi:CopG family transcriptional regulator, nickel-responsive regulator
MEVTVLKGPGADVQQLADHVIAERGVRHGQVVYLPETPHAQESRHRDGHVHGGRGRK